MKKLLFILATVSLLTLASCSSKESKCEKAISNTMKISGMNAKIKGPIAEAMMKVAVEKCLEKYDEKAVSCLGGADSLADIAKCEK